MPVTCSLTVSSCWCLTSSASLVWLYNVISSYTLPSLLRCEIQRLSESEMIALGLMGCDRFSYVFWTHVNSQHPQILCQWIPQYSWNKIPFGIFFIFNLISDSFHCCLLLLRILNLFRLEEMPGGCLIQLRAMSSQVLNISKGEDAAGSLSNFFPVLYCPHCDDFPYRISLPATCVHRLLLFAVHFQEKSGSFFSLTTHYVTEDSN